MDCCRACQSLGETESTERMPIRETRPDKLAIRVRDPRGDVSDHPFRKDVVVVGRTAGRADIVVRDAAISRVQCRFIFRNGEVEIEDLGSTCGTTVLGHKIQRTTLRWGDVVRVGDSELQIVRD
jgi:pSer/pThr/pTyr-binding forkhead associated (FHA) protein